MTPTPLMAPGETEERKVKALVCPGAAAKGLAPSSGLPHGDRAAALGDLQLLSLPLPGFLFGSSVIPHGSSNLPKVWPAG